jgi:hypothetical protein
MGPFIKLMLFYQIPFLALYLTIASSAFTAEEPFNLFAPVGSLSTIAESAHFK